MRASLRFLASAMTLMTLLFCHAAGGPVMAAEPAYSGDNASAGSNADPLAGGSPESTRFSYAPGMEKQLEEIIAATDALERGLETSERQLQSLHTADELASLLFRNPDWKMYLDKYRVADDGSAVLQWEQPGEEVYRALTERGVSSSRLQWKGIGVAPQQNGSQE